MSTYDLLEHNKKNKSKKKRKPDICNLCGKLVPSCFPRHLTSKHPDNIEVQRLLELRNRNAPLNEIREVTSKLRKEAYFNVSETSAFEYMIPVRRSREDMSLSACKHCKGFYSKDNFRKHWRKCFTAKKSPYTNVNNEMCDNSDNSEMIIPASDVPLNTSLEASNSESALSNIPSQSSLDETQYDPNIGATKTKRESTIYHKLFLPKRSFDSVSTETQKVMFTILGDDDLSKLAMNDELIISYFKEKYPHKKQTLRGLKHLKRLIRDVARLLQTVQSLDPTISCLKDVYNCQKFHILLQAVREIANISSNGVAGKTSINGRIRSVILRCLVLYRCEALTKLTGDSRRLILEELSAFQECIDSKWAVEFGSFCEGTKKKLAVDKEIEVTHPEDVVLASEYCIKRYNTAVSELYKNVNEENYDNLMKLVLVHLVVLSRRRAVDLDQATKSNYGNIKRNREFSEKIINTNSFSNKEKEAIQILDAFFTHGKGKQKTICFITKQIITAIDALLFAQKEFKTKGELLFSKLCSGNEEWSTSKAMAWARKVMPLKDPKNFSINGLRHLAATQGSLWADEDPTILPSMLEGLTHNQEVHDLYYKRTITDRLTKSWGRKLYEATLPSKQISTTVLDPPKDYLTKVQSSSAGEDHTEASVILEDNIEIHSHPAEESHVDASVIYKENVEEDASDSANLNDPDWTPDNNTDETSFQTPKKLLTRKRWSTLEHNALIRQFHSYIKKRKVPPRYVVKNAITQESPLAKRSIESILIHLHHVVNEKSAPARELLNLNDKILTPDAVKFGKRDKKLLK